MRALDCVHEAHDDTHFEAASDDELVSQVMKHRDEHHPEMSDDDVRSVVSSGAYDA